MPSTQLTELTNAENLLGPRGSRGQLFGGSRDHWEWSQNLWRCTRFVMGVALKIHDKTETSIEIKNKPWFFIINLWFFIINLWFFIINLWMFHEINHPAIVSGYPTDYGNPQRWSLEAV